eukprot:CAMPEP_0172327346 /NCGR_PEP_ID=MMETSP1058-20130122/59319_1 /TAXON_ID=83371 /ORGANISM="Detonula confervacea, Strain CCMP 353" /LENGTH=560 /DNA_ID=CAMNT_0013044373 /DNA_START=177 /DNA_END=1859 /DNA_ORIENTATION=-
MAANRTAALPYLHVAAALSIMCISSAAALSQNPSPSSRYLKEMAKLLRNDQQQLHAVASPARAPSETEADLTWEDDDYDHLQQQYQPSSSFRNMLDEPAFNMFDEPAHQSDYAEQQGFQTPHPPTDPYSRHQKELFEEYDQTSTTTDQSYYQRQTNELPNHQPRRDTELFDALNEHIEALDQQIQTSSSLRSVVDDKFPQPELEWEYDVQDGYFPAENSFETTEQFKSYGKIPVTQPFEQSESEHYPDGSFYAPASQSVENSFEATEQFQSYEQIPDTALTQPEEQSEPEHYYPMALEMERLAAEKKAAEEGAKLAEQQLQENNRRLERERLEQERLRAARADAARVEHQRQEKIAIENELARQKAEEYKRRIEAKHKPPAFIVKSRYLPQLPDTNDPLQLLGLDYRHPPENANDIRRAFLKMAKKYHPDAVAADATPEEREKASLNFARINSAYQLLKDKQEQVGDEYFATMLGGPMYEPRNRRTRQSFSRGNGADDYGGSIFGGNSYSATYGARNGEQPGPQNGNYRKNPNPFARRNRQEVSDNCHVSSEEFPPFFNN